MAVLTRPTMRGHFMSSPAIHHGERSNEPVGINKREGPVSVGRSEIEVPKVDASLP